jgi:hypothetical protein
MMSMMGKRLHGYLQQWKEFTVYKRNLVYTRIKDQILKLYKDKLFYVFERWKSGANAA